MLLTDKTSPIFELIESSRQTEPDPERERREGDEGATRERERGSERERERRKRGGGSERGSRLCQGLKLRRS